MSLYYLQKNYYDALLSSDSEFLTKETRLYFLLRKLTYNGSLINVAIPIRTNISLNHIKQTIPLPPNSHTKKNYIGGWHINKLIPVTSDVLRVNSAAKTKELQVAEYIGKVYLQEMKEMAQELLKSKENKQNVFGMIDFDAALKILQQLNNA